VTPWPYPRWIAHRGAGKLAPENTLAAFRLGASHGYRGFECDVKLSADGVPFLLHDATLERTTNGRGGAGELAWAELSRLDAGSWHSPRYAGEPPASLQAVSAFLQANDYWLDLEIKPTPGTDAHTGAAVAEAVSRLWHGQERLPLLSSFQPEALRAARDSAPGLRRALLLDRLEPGSLDMALSLGCVALIANHTFVDQELVTRVHENGLHVMAFTVNSLERSVVLRELGVRGIVTDEVGNLGHGAS